MDSLNIQGFTESWFPKTSWDFLIFLYNVSNIRNKRKYLNKDSVRFSHIVYNIQALFWTPWSESVNYSSNSLCDEHMY